MQTILFVIPSLDYGGAARQLTLIAEGLPRDRFRPRVCVLGGDAPWAKELRASGVEVDILGWKRAFDPAPFLALRRLAAELRPDVVHLWGRAALRRGRARRRPRCRPAVRQRRRGAGPTAGRPA